MLLLQPESTRSLKNTSESTCVSAQGLLTISHFCESSIGFAVTTLTRSKGPGSQHDSQHSNTNRAPSDFVCGLVPLLVVHRPVRNKKVFPCTQLRQPPYLRLTWGSAFPRRGRDARLARQARGTRRWYGRQCRCCRCCRCIH